MLMDVNQIILTVISCAFTCSATIFCFWLKLKTNKNKINKDFLNLIADEKIKEIKIFVDRDNSFKSESSLQTIKNNDMNIEVLLERGCSLHNKEIECITEQLNISKGNKNA
jgi:hypothetical protein